MTYTLSNLYSVSFGKDDAAADANQGFLSKVFYKTSFYNRIKNGQRLLITGRKGTGKSATCIALKNVLEGEGKRTILVTPKLLSVPKMQQFQNTAMNQDEKFEYCWKYVFLVKISLEIFNVIDIQELKSSVLNSHEKQQLREVRTFLSENKEIDKTVPEKLISKLNIFSKFSAKLFGVEAGVETRKIVDNHDLSDLLDKFESSILKILEKLPNTSITILVDEVDDIWDSSNESTYLIIGLLNAIRKINSSLSSKATILAFLRSDIWDELSFASKDKLRSEEERISWVENDLKRLIGMRGKISANIIGFEPEEEVNKVWETLFDAKVNEEDSFKYIVDRTLKRPREVIQFCNLALSIAQDKQHSRITQEDILEAESTYSGWKIDDLINEYKVQYPFLKDLLAIFQGFESSFSKQQFDIRYEQAKPLLIKRFPKLSELDSNVIVQILFTIGFFGGRIQEKNVYIYDGQERYKIVLPNIENLEILVVHPAFHRGLGVGKYKLKIENKTININQISTGDILIQGNINIGTRSGVYLDEND
ncbi:MAG: hypothetical protein KME64_26145 [Scytonematopsis contorta HA4267-MV1]|jgi:DNA polymerase III delta prime subunit|nr:hypothetical protein [Scytonematopsis contorta HA4267-MV1]